VIGAMARSRPSTRAVAWCKQDPPGAEFALVELDRDRLRATDVAIGSAPEPLGGAAGRRAGSAF
jgi:hypothetical protein